MLRGGSCSLRSPAGLFVIGAHAFDDFHVQFAFGHDLREFLCRQAEFLQELAVGRSGVDVITDVVPQHRPGLVRNPWQPGNSTHGKCSASRAEFDGFVHGIHLFGSFLKRDWT